MLNRPKFITNSSSTCFIAYGIDARGIDASKCEEIYEADIEQDGAVGIAKSVFDADNLVFYWLDSELPADEYSLWQSVEHPYIDDIIRRQALDEFKRVAEKYGCDLLGNPGWGFFNSGH